MEPPLSTIAVVDDDTALRESLVWLLSSVGLTAQPFASGDAFLAAQRDHIAVLLLDVRMPGLSGLQVQQALLDQQDTLPIIMMTGHGDVPMAVAALKAGAFEFIEKPFNHQQIIEIVQRALEHARQRHQAQAQVASLKARYRSLKPKEQQIMAHVAHGLTNREIAEQMEVSPKTVEVYRLRAMKTMQAGNVADWVRQAVALGLVAALPP
ncbi:MULTISPECIES: response regulator transcription factor [unclassified Halomonas]|jgi:RNA polymerase sigma factor (sigma-70 family)|uniref:response regulator transcription factor n=1 Tax=unclassified Halomonas TaxID=2609666 RepID=UPI0011A1FEB2|nr:MULTISPECIES: response regulator [unclassified Halomonas]MDM7482556.1 response regulator [Halomonas sp.]UDM09152.1 response regulator [Halomonas sp. NyZ770]